MTTVDLFARALRLHPDGAVTAEERRMGAEVAGWTVATFHVETNQDVHGDHWEVHPAAEEAVCVLAGAARIVLRGDEAPITLTAGSACLVPRGRWHRLEIDGPTDLMSITLRAGSRLEKRA